MEVWLWITHNWFDLLSSAGIVGGLLFTGHSMRSETKTRRISNLLTLTQNHREIWTEFYRRPQLARVLDAAADLDHAPVTLDEQIFVTLVIQHLHAVHQSIRNGLVMKPEGVRRDVWSFFSLPIPKAVWEQARLLQDASFVAFVDSCLNWK
jgi:hypothetical protein